MLRGLYTAATGMIHQREKLNTIANNLSNTNTRGYKKDSVVSHSFKDELLLRTGGQTREVKALGPLNHGVYAERIIPSFRMDLEQTINMPSSLQGSGFTILVAAGFYTRDGTFRVDNEHFGYHGRPWVAGGQVTFNKGDDFHVDQRATYGRTANS